MTGESSEFCFLLLTYSYCSYPYIIPAYHLLIKVKEKICVLQFAEYFTKSLVLHFAFHQRTPLEFASAVRLQFLFRPMNFNKIRLNVWRTSIYWSPGLCGVTLRERILEFASVWSLRNATPSEYLLENSKRLSLDLQKCSWIRLILYSKYIVELLKNIFKQSYFFLIF